MLANALGILTIICLDVHMTRNDLASLVVYALPKLSRKIMDLSASDVVFRVLIEKASSHDLYPECLSGFAQNIGNLHENIDRAGLLGIRARACRRSADAARWRQFVSRFERHVRRWRW